MFTGRHTTYPSLTTSCQPSATSKSEVGFLVQSPHHATVLIAAICQAGCGSLRHIPSGRHHPDKQHRNPILLSLASHVTSALPSSGMGLPDQPGATPSGSCQAVLSKALPRWAIMESVLSALGLLCPTAGLDHSFPALLPSYKSLLNLALLSMHVDTHAHTHMHTSLPCSPAPLTMLCLCSMSTR